MSAQREGEVTVKRSFVVALAVVGLIALAAVGLIGTAPVGSSPQAMVPNLNGQIAFQRFDPSTRDFAVYRVNPDGSHLHLIFHHSDGPYWSPDGREVSFYCCGDGMIAHIFDVDDGVFREIAPLLNPPDLHCGLWTPDGTRLACLSSDGVDPRTGIWTIGSADGSNPVQITSNPGGEDDPGDFSPDGRSLVFLRIDQMDEFGHQSGFSVDVVRTNGSGLRQITPWVLPSQAKDERVQERLSAGHPPAARSCSPPRWTPTIVSRSGASARTGQDCINSRSSGAVARSPTRARLVASIQSGRRTGRRSHSPASANPPRTSSPWIPTELTSSRSPRVASSPMANLTGGLTPVDVRNCRRMVTNQTRTTSNRGCGLDLVPQPSVNIAFTSPSARRMRLLLFLPTEA